MRGLILSAGLGERLRPFTLKRAKPAIEFLNIPMLGFPYYWLNTLKLDQISFNTHYLAESIRHAAMHVVDPAIPMHFSHEENILGSGGGIGFAKHLLEGDHFAVANGDGVILCEHKDTIEQMLDFHVRKNALATLLVCPLEGVGTRLPGVWMDNTGEVVNFGKSAKKTYTECFHYASYMIFSQRVWQYIPEGSSNILYDILEPQIADGEKVYGFRVDNMRWFETGNAEEYLAATKTCLELMKSNSALGRCARDILETLSPHTEFKDMHLISEDADVSEEAQLSGFVVIGDGVRVESGARLQSCVLLPGSHAGKNESVFEKILI
jgi:NDP-sugar pyrophosphorylase family protein